jgi:paraquat-inducible protein B
MSREVNRVAVGGFIVGAVGLAVFAVLVFGSGRFFQKTTMQVMFFDGSVKGLSVGSPVKFRGVDIGEVKKIKLSIKPDDLEFYVPVYVEIFRNKISIMGEEKVEKFDDEVIDKLVNEMGLRAQLQMQSLLTGQLFINYDFYPDTPIRKVGMEKKVYEVPTIPTTMQMLTDTVEEILEEIRQANFREIITDIAQTVKGTNALVNSSELQESVTALHTALNEMQRLIKNGANLIAKVDGRVDGVADSFESTLEDADKLVNTIDSRVNPLAADFENVLATIQNSFEKVADLLTEAQKLTSENSKLRGEILHTLESMSDASQSVEELTDYLQRHPEAIITGKH